VRDDTLIPLFMGNLKKLEKFAKNSQNTKEGVISQIEKLEQLLAKDRSIQQHRCLQSYFTHLYLNYGKIFKCRQGFIDDIKSNIGYVEKQDSKIFYSENGETKTMLLRKYVIQSLSFPACTQDLHQEIFDKVIIYAWFWYNDDFDKWFAHWKGNENTLQ
jgi:hypothetical protein